MAQNGDAFLSLLSQMAVLNKAGVSLPSDVIASAFDEAMENDSNQNSYDSKDIPIKIKDVEFMRKYVIGGKLKITEENVDYLLEKNPRVFDGIDLEIINKDDDDYFEES